MKKKQIIYYDFLPGTSSGLSAGGGGSKSIDLMTCRPTTGLRPKVR